MVPTAIPSTTSPGDDRFGRLSGSRDLATGRQPPTSPRVLLVTGKGGTGKTTVAASTALRAADRGVRTLVVSTDAAHSLGDALGCHLGPNPTTITPTLSAQEIDTQDLFDRSWSTIRDYLRELLEWAGAERLRAEELAVVPGLEELLALRAIAQQVADGWDVVVVDCAPTAETVRLLALPSTLRTYIERLLPAHRRVARSVAPILRRAKAMPPAPDGVLDAVLALADELYAFHEALTDPYFASFRLVTTPESMVIAETRRVWSYLALFGYGVDSLVVNRVVSEGATDPWLRQLRQSQTPHLDEIDRLCDGLQRWQGPIRAAEVTGIERLREFGLEVYGSDDPLGARPPAVAADDADRPADAERLTFELSLPGVSEDELKLARAGTAVLVTIGPHRRSFTLPPHLHGRVATAARISNGHLEVEFAR
jgi:arsenite/tail-anchored protein-transporting ATPase